MRTTLALRAPFTSPSLSFTSDSQEFIALALQARLDIIEREILRLAQLASTTNDLKRQQEYLTLAQDLQKDAREIRAELHRHSQAASEDSWWAACRHAVQTHLNRLLNWRGGRLR